MMSLTHTMKAGVMAVLTLAAVFQAAAMAEPIGHDFDVQVSVVNGKLTTNKQLYDGLFDEFLSTTDPGFSGAPPAGQQYSFVVPQKLWYHSGIVGDPVSTAPGNPFLKIGEDPNFVTVSQTTGFQPGLTLAASLSGSLHVHLNFELFPQGGSPAPAGVYGLVLQLTSPSFQTSDPFVIALTNLGNGDLTPAGVAYGEQAIREAALVPEPGAGILAGLGMAAAAGSLGLRRSRSRRPSCN